MNRPQIFRKVEERTFFAHHMLLHAADLDIRQAESTEVSRFNMCLAAMVMTSLAVEALINAVGSRVSDDWSAFEMLRPHEKIDWLVQKLGIVRDESVEPWSALRFLGKFRNEIAHAKPENIVQERLLPEAGLLKEAFKTPLSSLERQITPGNARRVHAAVESLKGLLADALDDTLRFGIYGDMWHGSTFLHES